MLPFILRYWIDVGVFAVVAYAACFAVDRWLQRGERGRITLRGWVAVTAIIAAAAAGAVAADAHERHTLTQRLEGLAPTYAQEIELLGHAKIGFDTPADSADYLKIINAEIRWEKVNPNVADIYTYRRRADGKIAFVVDSETDYDHDGKIDDDREQRTAIGEAYDEATPGFCAALDGVAGIDEEPITDRWGTWISAYVPLLDANGHVEAALGVDYDAGRWSADVLQSRLGALGIGGAMLMVVVGATALLSLSQAEAAKRMALQRQLVVASREAALHDGLTGLPNRLLFSERLTASLDRSKGDASYQFAVMFIDCDNFKGINDTLGHHAGDALLKQIGNRLRGVLRGDDIAARIGGDEFAVLLCGISAPADAIRVAQRILSAGAAPYTLADQFVNSGMSIGVATVSVTHKTPEDVMRDADAAMYKAKQSGRNRFVVFDDTVAKAA